MSCGIYKIENNINHMIYIGQSINIEQRFVQHKNNKNHYDIHVAIQEFGVNNFSFEIIELCSKDQLNEREQFWIKFYDCQKPKGYNKTPGGTGWNPAVEASKIKVGQYDLQGNFINEFESIAEAERQTSAGHISDVLNQNNRKSGEYMWISLDDKNNFFPKKISPWIPTNHLKRQKAVYQINKDTEEIVAEFSSLKEAAQAIGQASSSHISAVLRGERKTAGGYKWKEKLI